MSTGATTWVVAFIVLLAVAILVYFIVARRRSSRTPSTPGPSPAAAASYWHCVVPGQPCQTTTAITPYTNQAQCNVACTSLPPAPPSPSPSPFPPPSPAPSPAPSPSPPVKTYWQCLQPGQPCQPTTTSITPFSDPGQCSAACANPSGHCVNNSQYNSGTNQCDCDPQTHWTGVLCDICPSPYNPATRCNNTQ